MNHIFVDFENVHEIDLTLFEARSFRFTLLLGPQQKKLDVDLVEKLLAHAASVELVRLTFNGKNALDFALAYYVGRAVTTDPTGVFHIVSKDTGFDPLIEHLRGRQIRAKRHRDCSSLTLSGSPKEAETLSGELLAQVREHLEKNGKHRPKKRKTLETSLTARFVKVATPTQISQLVDLLVKSGDVSIGEKEAVEYHL